MNNKLILGTVQFGCQYGINSVGKPTEQMVSEILKEAYANGVKTLDTSSAYGDAEQVLGNCITQNNDFKIVSKYPQCNLTAQEAFHASLIRLKVSHLYGYLLHHFCVFKNNPKIWNDFLLIREKGLVNRIGFSLYTPEELEILLNKRIDFDLLQIPYNIFDRKFESYFPVLNDMGVEIHVRSTFLQGLFFKNRNELPEKLKPLEKYLRQLDEYAANSGLTIAELALNFNIQNPFIQGVLMGVDNVEQLKNNIKSIVDSEIDLNIIVKEQELLNPVNWN